MNKTFNTIPEELREIRNWVNWERDGNRKVPKNPKTGRNAVPTIPETWGSFADACNRSDQIGFVLSEDDPYVCIDYDNCVEHGVINDRVQKTLKHTTSYAEFSPSGTGIHIFVKGTLPHNIAKHKYPEGCSIEIYSQKHYMTMTGNHVEGTPLTISYQQDLLDKAFEKLGTKEASKRIVSNVKSDLTDREVWQIATKKYPKIQWGKLLRGDISMYKNDHSNADWVFCVNLAKVTQDEEQLDRMFRKTKLMRDKWDFGTTITYGQRTIQKAIQKALIELDEEEARAR